MKVYDISQEVFSCRVYPGDPKPERIVKKTVKDHGYNLTLFSMCAHNGTHMDAPYHFLEDGATIDQMPVETFVGECYVARHEGDVDDETAREILRQAKGTPRILIAGDCTVTEAAARVFADGDVILVGNESQSVGPLKAPRKVHYILLGKGIALLEGLVMEAVPVGHYILSAAPLKLAGADGAPCRACLIKL